MSQQFRPYDHDLLAHDGVATLTSTNEGQVGGADAIIDFGGEHGAMFRGDLVVDVASIDTGTGDETYSLRASFSANANGSSPTIEYGITITAAGRYVIPCHNIGADGAVIRYGFFRAVLAGTTPILQAKAFFTRQP